MTIAERHSCDSYYLYQYAIMLGLTEDILLFYWVRPSPKHNLVSGESTSHEWKYQEFTCKSSYKRGEIELSKEQRDVYNDWARNHVYQYIIEINVEDYSMAHQKKFLEKSKLYFGPNIYLKTGLYVEGQQIFNTNDAYTYDGNEIENEIISKKRKTR